MLLGGSKYIEYKQFHRSKPPEPLAKKSGSYLDKAGYGVFTALRKILGQGS